MREEVKRWIEKAEKDLDAAEYLFKGKKYEECSLFCQQSVEKALKSVLLNRTNKIIRIHDLKVLASKVNLPKELMGLCEELTSIYLITRYPDSPNFRNNSEEANKYIIFAKEILKWAEKNM